MKKSLIATLLIGATVLPALQGCFPVVAAGVTSGVMATVDRRTLGVQTDDETIEWKANAQVSEKVGDKAHLNFTSYNRKVLITGEVPSEDAKSEAERIVGEALEARVSAVRDDPDPWRRIEFEVFLVL